MYPKYSRPKSTDEAAIRGGYRSGLEDKVAAQLRSAGIDAQYEEETLRYIVPERGARYTPDFVLPNGIVVETKGYFKTADRQKHVLIKRQYPELDLRFVFSNSNTRISKGSPTTYATWCRKHGFLFADHLIPEAWLHEPPRKKDPIA